MNENIVLICAVLLAFLAMAAGVTLTSVREWDFKKAAVEHGCGITYSTVVCAHGDRK